MTTETVSSSRPTRTIGFARDWLVAKRHQQIAALVLYAAVAIGFFGVHVLPHLATVCVCQPGPADSSIFMWSLAWWPHALLHGMNPFFTNAVFAPDHVDLGGSTTVPGAALVMAPVTLLFGPIVSYNILMLAAPVLAAFFAFLLCRYITSNFAASLVGGYLFGFSAFMFGELLGHVHMVLIFPIPVAVHLTLRLIDGRITRRRFVTLMALTLIALVSFSTELALTLVLVGTIALVAAYILAPAARRHLIDATKLLVVTGALAMVVASPIIYYGLKGNVTAGTQGIGDALAGDSLGFLVPTALMRLTYFASVSAKFTSGNTSESGIYVGLPLALIVAWYAITRWRLASTRILVTMLAVVGVLLLGSHLHVAGHSIIPLPWKLVDHSLLREVIPARFGLYVFLIVGMITAMWLAEPRTRNWALAKWGLVAVSVAFLLPNVGSGNWRWAITNPSFFTTHDYRAMLRPGETVLVLPYGYEGLSMLWQADTGMWFRMTGGYLNPAPPPDYATDPFLPMLLGEVKPDPLPLRNFLARRHVTAVIVDPAYGPQWTEAIAALGLKPVATGGILLYRL